MTVCVCAISVKSAMWNKLCVYTPYEYEMCATVRGIPVAGWQRSFGVQASGMRIPGCTL